MALHNSMTTQIFRLLLVSVSLLIGILQANAAPPIKEDFPRLGLMLIGGDGHRYHEADYQRSLARFDFVVLNMNPAWARGSGPGSTPNEKQAYVLQQIRALNPNIILSNYTIVAEAPDRVTNAHGDLWDKLHAEVGPPNAVGNAADNNWWARSATGEIESAWPGTWITNITDHVTADKDGYTYPEWYARRIFELMFRDVPQWDGVYHDVARFKPREPVDWDRDGVDDDPDDWETQLNYRQGHVKQWRLERQLMPGKLMTGNIGSWGRSVVLDYGRWVLDEFDGTLEGGYLEKYMGLSWSLETNHGWEKMMDAYRVALRRTADPKLVVLNAGNDNKAGADLYRFFRYGFASTLMDDGYFDFSDSHAYSEISWFDEYDLAGTATTSWLGKAVDPPQLSPWNNGVYRRRFEYGIVLVNPRGNGTRTVEVEPGYRFISGNQDPTVNTGQLARSVRLVEGDGILLVNENAQKIVRPKAPVLGAD
jgi:hypothetical protein